MLIEKWQPLMAPDGEQGAGGVDTGGEPGGGAPPPSPPPMNERPVDGPGSGRSAIRKDLEGAFERDRKGTEERDRQTGQFRQRQRPGPNEAPAPQGAQPTEQPAPVEAPATPAPEAFSQEAKAEWAQTPPNVQAAIIKREQDMNKGVQELRQRYQDVDQALQPRMDVIRRHGHSPGQAINQLFLWFEALSANPKEAFPALAQSFRVDPKIFLGDQPAPQAPLQQQPGQAPPTAQQPVGAVSPEVQRYITNMEQRLNQLGQAVAQKIGSLETNFQQQGEAKTREILDNWSRGKDHFEDVRGMMAHLIGSGAVPPLANGGADLDKAYDMAMYALPDVRQKVYAAQQARQEAERKAKEVKEKQAQQEAADKARRAAGGLSLNAPGTPVTPALRGTKRGKTVKESLAEAMEQVRGS